MQKIKYLMQLWKKYKTQIKIFISLIALGILLYKVDTSKVFNTFSQVNLTLIILGLLYYIVNTFFNYLTLHILFKSLKKRISVWCLLESFWYAASIGQFLPGTMGELSLAKILKNKKNFKFGTTLSVYLLDKIISLIVVICIGLLGVFIFFPKEENWFISTGIILLFSVFGSLLLLNQKIRSILRKKVLKKHATRFSGFATSFDELLLRQKKSIFINFGVTFFRMALLSSIVSFMFLEFGFFPPVTLILVVNSIAVMSRLIPISLGGIGFREGISVLLLATQGYDTAVVTTIYVLLTVISLILNGGYFMVRFNMSKGEGFF